MLPGIITLVRAGPEIMLICMNVHWPDLAKCTRIVVPQLGVTNVSLLLLHRRRDRTTAGDSALCCSTFPSALTRYIIHSSHVGSHAHSLCSLTPYVSIALFGDPFALEPKRARTSLATHGVDRGER